MGFRILGVQVRYFREQLISPLKEFEPLRLLVAFNSNDTTNDCDYQTTEGYCYRNNRDAKGWLCLAKTRDLQELGHQEGLRSLLRDLPAASKPDAFLRCVGLVLIAFKV